jgi:hypothetical protein
MNKCYQISEKRKELIDDKLLNYIEIIIEEGNFYNYLLFKNFYTEKVNIFSKEYILMNDPECEIDSEKYFVLELEEGVNKFKIYLTQNCKVWNNFTITDIKLLKSSDLTECKFKYEIYSQDTNGERYLDIMKIKDQYDLKFSILK